MHSLWNRFREDERATILTRALSFSAIGLLSSFVLATLPLAAWAAARDQRRNAG